MESFVVQSLRDLDALVAEKLFGWRWLPWFGNTEQLILVPDESYFHSLEILGRNILHFVPKYSIDVAAAWIVISEIDKQGYEWAIICPLESSDQAIRQVKIGKNGVATCKKLEELPTAICLAALKTVGIEVQLQLADTSQCD